MSTYDSGLSQTRTASDPRLNEPLYGASLGQAIRRFFGKYAHFKGYASRSEYWWIQLFMAVIGGLISIPFLQTYDPVQGTFDLTQGTGNVEGLVLASSMAVFVWALATFIPFLALSWRRLHDAGFPGPMYLLALIPVIGGLVVLILMLLPTRFDKRNPEWE